VVKRRSRLALGGLILIAAWFVTLLILDAVVKSRQSTATAGRIGESLQGSATLGDVDVALIRGRLELEQLSVHRDDVIGHLSLDVADIDCELAPLGWALFQLKNPKRRPIRADRVVIDDAELTFAPSAFLPSLGRIRITVDHAEAGPTVFVTPLSWIFGLSTLHAHVELPAGLAVNLTYDHGVFGAAGSLFGSTPVQLPLELPVATLYVDAHAEVAALIKLGTNLAEQLVAKRAEDWLRQKF